MEDFTMRQIEATKADYDAYVQCIYRTEFSHEIGQRSEERDAIALDYDPAPKFEFFCRVVKHYDTHSQKHILVYENAEGKVVAVATINKLGNLGLVIQKFVVDRNYQLEGYGKKFFEEIVMAARKDGRRKIILRCNFEGSMVFWNKMGFIHSGSLFAKEIAN